jgi:hypothetical protein
MIRTKTNNVEIVAGPSGHDYFRGSVEISAFGHIQEVIYFHSVEDAVQHAAAIVSDEVEYPNTGIDYTRLGREEAAHAAAQFHQ